MSGDLLSEWMAFAKLEPFGPEAEDFRAAQIAFLHAAAIPSERATPLKVSDFMQGEGSQPEPPTDAELAEKLKRSFGIQK